jgi:hypothetical protein
MARQFKLSARDMEMRLASTGFTIRVEEDNQDLSGRLHITKVGITWTPKRAWPSGPRSVRILWADVPNVFAEYRE